MKKGEKKKNACAVKPSLPYVTRKTVERTPVSQENKNRVDFIDSHNFFSKVNKETGSLQCKVEKK